jgi:hypothetical protein
MPALQSAISLFAELRASWPISSTVLLVVAAPLSLCLTTFALTWLRFYHGTITDRGQKRDALIVPYWFPFLGLAIPMTKNLQKTVEWIR